MHSYAAFLRGIMPSNPNMRGEKLRGVFEGLGFEKVSTLLSSGNVVFQTRESNVPALESKIQQALNTELGIPGGTLIRTRSQLQTLVDSDPFAGLTHCRETYLVVTFLRETPNSLPNFPADDTGTVRIIRFDPEAAALLSVIDNTNPSTTNFMAVVEKTLAKDITTRTFLTVQKVLKKMDA
ncbi:DUF1697 domain-containing protein [Nocardia seriolae]|uniref:Uncharacterized protein n=1 Tax=Nocardia seriolae TaxID=37332 RepID=A0A0B8NDS5_9NOCA|nr:DUF1697 domain-containing protein [Nocardia seriolae]MTJ61811.1 DUF1697 domain-containing protein [Nocardia seriolae]MTJ73081.1 DUF1697 domain-containing protein [Nocardia seriolae]MTJ90153.1 DUF1697 domain-containing protein [Nocardia seriolae]MTK34116.1 DUF1697 domain-containing protein [Nocardia seriolae]MTK39756.1 DUF1697 domain-containing protein [Nocardia seriolae]